MADLATLFNQLIELPESARSSVLEMAKAKQQQRLSQPAPAPAPQKPTALAAFMAKKAPTMPRSSQNPAMSAETKVRSLGAKLGALQRGV